MASIANTTFACEDPGRLAEFRANAVDYEVQAAPPGLLEAIEAEVERLATLGASVVETRIETPARTPKPGR